MFDNFTCAKCSNTLAVFTTIPVSYSLCPPEDQQNVELGTLSKNLGVQDQNSKSPSISHQSVNTNGLSPTGSEDSIECFNDEESTRLNSSIFSPRANSSISRQLNCQFTSPHSHITSSLNESWNNLRVPVAQTIVIDDAEEINLMNPDIDEGFCDLHNGINEIDAIQTQLDILMAGRELHLTQMAKKNTRVRKIGTTFRWRRSADFVKEGRPMVRNKIRMRKTWPVRSAS